MFLYPWGDMHSLNLGWFLMQFKDWVEKIQEYLDNGGGTSENLANVIAPVFNAANYYSTGDYVLYNNELYKANQAVNPGTWDPDAWTRCLIVDEMGSGGGSAGVDNVARLMIAGQYSPSFGYQKYAICRYNDKLWMCNTNLPSGGEAWNAAHWDEITVGAGLTGLRRSVETLSDDVTALNNAIDALGTEVDTAKIVLDDGTVIDDNSNTTYIRLPRQLVEFTFEQNGNIWRRKRATTEDPWGGWEPIATKSMFNRTNCNAVFFGDSWTVGTGIAVADRPTKRFSAIVSQKLGCNEFNYGVGAAGFIRTGNLISTQIATAASAMSTGEKSGTGVVVIVGGVNDYRQQLSTSTVNDFITGVINTATLAHNTFPNAIIVLGIGNTNLSYFPQAAKHWYQWAIRAAEAELKFPHIVIKNLYNAISGLAENYSNDNLHPNELGHARFGGYIADAILGGGQDVSYYVQDVELASNFSWGETGGVTIAGKLYRENDEFVITPCYLAMESAISANTQYGSIPEKMAPAQNMYGQFYRSNQIKGASAITYSGGLYINPTESVSSGFISQLRWFFGKEINTDET